MASLIDRERGLTPNAVIPAMQSDEMKEFSPMC
jgi:hypothetical protein